MKRSILLILCTLALLLGLSLTSCQKKEPVTEAPKQTEQKPADSAGYGGQKSETGGYGK